MAGLPVEFRRDDTTFSAGIAKLPAYARGLQRAKVAKVTTYVLPMSNDRPYLANFKLHAARLREAARILRMHPNSLRRLIRHLALRDLLSRAASRARVSCSMAACGAYRR